MSTLITGIIVAVLLIAGALAAYWLGRDGRTRSLRPGDRVREIDPDYAAKLDAKLADAQLRTSGAGGIGGIGGRGF